MNGRSSLAAMAFALALAGGCAAPAYPPAIDAGSACAACGMSIENMRFACEQQVGESWRAYDSIECLVRDAQGTDQAFLSDHDAKTLHAADSMWVVRGRIDSPMGGGLAAFLTREQADDVAGSTDGEVLRLEALSAARRSAAP